MARLKEHLDFEYEFVNLPWPGKTIYTDILPKRIINLVRILFNENMFPLDVDRVIYRDADQCTMTNTDLKLLYETDIKAYPQAMVPHCEFYNGRGYDHNKAI